MGYTPNYSHLVGIMIINHWVFRGTQHFQTNPFEKLPPFPSSERTRDLKRHHLFVSFHLQKPGFKQQKWEAFNSDRGLSGNGVYPEIASWNRENTLYFFAGGPSFSDMVRGNPDGEDGNFFQS